MNFHTTNPAAEDLIERITDADAVQVFEKIEAYGWERAYTLGRARVIITLEEVTNGQDQVTVAVLENDAFGNELARSTFTNVTGNRLPRIEEWIGDTI